MICFELAINGKFLCRAGVENATVISPNISMFADTGKAAHLRLSALTKRADGRSTHVSWFDEIELSSGDDISFTMLESNAPSPCRHHRRVITALSVAIAQFDSHSSHQLNPKC